LKEFCDFVEIRYEELLYHTKTRWLTLFPAIGKLQKMYPALKAYFLSQPKNSVPSTIRNFFEDEMAELYLWFLHSNMFIFHVKISELERENMSATEVIDITDFVLTSLRNRLQEEYVPLNVREALESLTESGLEQKCIHFKKQMAEFYNTCLEYLQKWILPLEELKCFQWMKMQNLKNIKFKELDSCLHYLRRKNVKIEESKLFDQFCNLKQYAANLSEEDYKSPLDRQWVNFLKAHPNSESNSELLQICQFYFAIPSHNACVERVFSLINSQWTKERNRLCLESIKGIILVKFNLRHLSCVDFYQYLLDDKQHSLLRQIGSSEKYYVL
jgi:hypothetical protein